MEMTISPLDNRYYQEMEELSIYFSEEAWIGHRVYVEVEYFEYLITLLKERGYIPKNEIIKTRKLIESILLNGNMKKECIQQVKDIEKTTKHDIKAIEYWLRQKYKELHPDSKNDYSEYIHLGLTSQDINSVAFSIQLKSTINNIIFPTLKNLVNKILTLSDKWKSIVFLAMTHGQPAVPTLLGKEMKVFVERLYYLAKKLERHQHLTKFGGAVGNLNAHYAAFPDIDWNEEMDIFCNKFGLKRWHYTTQISNYDDIGILSAILVSINTTLLDLSRDAWLYISRGIFSLKLDEGQVGSSTMPQKVNPINFENAEGNLQMANTLLQFFQTKLPVSRMQRDLTDSTTLRNYGSSLGYMLIAFKNIDRGLNKLKPNTEFIEKELNCHPEILAEPVQIIMRKYCLSDAYDLLKYVSQKKEVFETEQEFIKCVITSITKNYKNVKKEMLDEISKLSVKTYYGSVSNLLNF